MCRFPELGTSYVVVQGQGGNLEKVFVTATVDNTDVFLNGSATPFTTLQEGDFALIPGNNFSGGAMFVETSSPAYVHHAIQGLFGSAPGQLANQDILLIAPNSIFLPTSVDEIGFFGRIGSTNYNGTELFVVTENGATLTVERNGTPQTIPAPSPVTGAAFEFRKIPVAPNGNVSVVSNAGVQVVSAGRDNLAAFTGYFSGFGTTPVITPATVDCATLGTG